MNGAPRWAVFYPQTTPAKTRLIIIVNFGDFPEFVAGVALHMVTCAPREWPLNHECVRRARRPTRHWLAIGATLHGANKSPPPKYPAKHAATCGAPHVAHRRSVESRIDCGCSRVRHLFGSNAI
jgi:hypothetical protein